MGEPMCGPPTEYVDPQKAEIARLRAQVDAVRALHTKAECSCDYGDVHEHIACAECLLHWPCETIAALGDADA